MTDSIQHQVATVDSDTLTVIIQKGAETLSASDQNSALLTIGAALTGSIIGGLITIWYKKKEIKNLSENLMLQKEVFEQNKINTENTLKSELIRLKELRKRFELSVQEHDLEHLKNVLEFSGDQSEKVSMLKDFVSYLQSFKNIPPYIEEYSEYQDYVVDMLYPKMEDIEKFIESLLDKYPHVFLNIKDKFTKIASKASYIEREIVAMSGFGGGNEDDFIKSRMHKDIFALYESFFELRKTMESEFQELDEMKRDYIKSQFSRRTQQ